MDFFKNDLAPQSQTYDLSFLSKKPSESTESEEYSLNSLDAGLSSLSFDTTSSQKVIDEASRFLKGSGLNFNQKQMGDIFTGTLNSKEKNYYAVTSMREAEFRLGW